MLDALFRLFFDDPDLDEILINGTRCMSLVGRAGMTQRPSPFSSASELAMWLQDLAFEAGLRLDPLNPSAGGTTQDARIGAARWHAILPPITTCGPLFALRRHRFQEVGLEQFDFTSGTRDRLIAAVGAGASVVVAGPTGSGKTSLLSALLQLVAAEERVVIAESLCELSALRPHWVHLVERRPNTEGLGAVTLSTLVQESLRLRPDRLVIGELRSTEAHAMIEAMTTGHGGVMATIHAGSAAQAWLRLATLAGLSPLELSNRLQDITIMFVMLRRGNPPRVEMLDVTSCRTAS